MEEIQGMKDRKEFLTHVNTYVNKSETVTGVKVVGIRLDNAPEFRSERTQLWAKSKGITLEYTTYYTLEQNGGRVPGLT